MAEQEVGLAEILAAREGRRQRQDEWRRLYRTVIVSITINIPGPVKDGPLIRQLCDFAVGKMSEAVPVVASKRLNAPTGPEALLAMAGKALDIKRAAMAIEEGNDFGRLLDIDVLAADGSLLSRHDLHKARPCLVCDRSALECRREGRHSWPELQAAVSALMAGFAAEQTRSVSAVAEKLGALAGEALLYEVSCTPSPGLVDRKNNGAHSDMDFFTFMAGSPAIFLSLARCAQAGLNHSQTDLAVLLPVLRRIGREGERAMFAATRGINTQKGLLFSLGIVAAAAGWRLRDGQKLTADSIFEAVARITAGIVKRELEDSRVLERRPTAGERLYREYGVTGIRGELENGLPAVRECGLPALKHWLATGLDLNGALVNTLLELLLVVEDTTVMSRHNPAKLRTWVRHRAGEALAAGGLATAGGREMVAALDEEFISQNISPGGAADLLAVTWFIYRLVNW